jgi:ABC-type transporter Mla subunit MlaD
MAETLAERLEQLEQAVRRAAEAIARLKDERDALRAKVTGLEAGQAELHRLKQERKEMLAQVDGMLKELDKLDL